MMTMVMVMCVCALGCLLLALENGDPFGGVQAKVPFAMWRERRPHLVFVVYVLRSLLSSELLIIDQMQPHRRNKTGSPMAANEESQRLVSRLLALRR
jgi:hypothetical protein